MNESFCPECESPLKISAHPHKGQQLICSRCRTRLVIINLDPLELDWATVVSQSVSKKKKAGNKKTLCPECNNTVKANQLERKGQQLTCQVCNSTLEVVNLNPLKIDVVAQQRSQPRSSRRMENIS